MLFALLPMAACRWLALVMIALLVSVQAFAQMEDIPATALAWDSISLPPLEHEPAVYHHQPKPALCQVLAPLCKVEQKLGFPVWRVAVPVGLLGLGALTSQGTNLFTTDRMVREELRERMPVTNTKIEDYFLMAPAYTAVGLSVVGIKGRHGTISQALIAVMATSLNGVVVNGLKQATGVRRPHGRSFDSFPSLHTSTVFATATVLHKEYGHRSVWYSIGGYSIATATAGMRMIGDNHWFSDVLAGAGVGIGCTELVYLAYPWMEKQVRRLLPTRKKLPAVALTPTYGAGGIGGALVLGL